MPRILAKKKLKSYRASGWALSLTTFLIVACLIDTGALASLNQAIEWAESARYSESVVAVDGETVAIGSQVTQQPGLVEGTRPPLSSKVLKEVGKQAIDQPGHFLIAAVPIWASRWLVGVPWYGWVAAPLLAYREWLQWPSNRWWDPPLDWIFLSSGALVATFRRLPSYPLRDGPQPLRGRLVRSLSFLMATGRRTRPAAT